MKRNRLFGFAATMWMVTVAQNARATVSPDCASWPTHMAMTTLKNLGLIEIEKLEQSRTKAIRLASEKLNNDLYLQIYDISLYQSDGRHVEVITRSQASNEECSISKVDIYLVNGLLVDPKT